MFQIHTSRRHTCFLFWIFEEQKMKSSLQEPLPSASAHLPGLSFQLSLSLPTPCPPCSTLSPHSAAGTPHRSWRETGRGPWCELRNAQNPQGSIFNSTPKGLSSWSLPCAPSTKWGQGKLIFQKTGVASADLSQQDVLASFVRAHIHTQRHTDLQSALPTPPSGAGALHGQRSSLPISTFWRSTEVSSGRQVVG